MEYAGLLLLGLYALTTGTSSTSSTSSQEGEVGVKIDEENLPVSRDLYLGTEKLSAKEIVDGIINGSIPRINYQDYNYLVTNKPNRDTTFVDASRELKDIGTEIVVNAFLESPESNFNFLKTVYGIFEESINYYIIKKQLPGKAIFFVYKGGNVLRIISNEFLRELPGLAAHEIGDYYQKFFKRSDADFSIYIDPKLETYDNVYNDMILLSYVLQRKLRAEFEENPERFFDVYKYTTDYQKQIFQPYFNRIRDANVFKDPNNSQFYRKKVVQFVFGKASLVSESPIDTDLVDLRPKDYIGKKDVGIQFVKGLEEGLKEKEVIVVKDRDVEPDLTGSVIKSRDLQSQSGGFSLRWATPEAPSSPSPSPSPFPFPSPSQDAPEEEALEDAPEKEDEDPEKEEIEEAPIKEEIEEAPEIEEEIEDTETLMYADDSSEQIAMFYLNEEPHSIYVQSNGTLDFRAGGRVKFALVRSKINFNVYLVSLDENNQIIGNGEVKNMQVGGELIDVSIPHRLDGKIQHFFDNMDIYLHKYELTHKGDLLTFTSYALIYLIEDLEYILFKFVQKPWEAPKYEKRVNRLFYLYMIDIFNKIKTNEQRQEFLEGFDSMLGELMKSTNSKDMDNIIDKFEKTYANDLQYLYIKHLLYYLKGINKILVPEDLPEYRKFLGVLQENAEIITNSFQNVDQYCSIDGSIRLKAIYDGDLKSLV